MNDRSTINYWIFITSEDNKYNVLGGIGTYVGNLSKLLRRYCPEIKDIYWLTKSHLKHDFSEVDEYGVKRYYFSDKPEYIDCKFYKNIINQPENSIFTFNEKISKKIIEIINDKGNLKGVVESPDWEGLGSDVFKFINNKNVLKVARIHTPLAVCIKYDLQAINSITTIQLIKEYLTLVNCDLFSAPTEYMLTDSLKEVWGNKSLLKISKKNQIVIPNPINDDSFRKDLLKREEAITFFNKVTKSNFLNNSSFNVFIIGSVEARKGVDLVIDSIPSLVDKIPDIKFCFIGRIVGETSTINKKLSSNSLLKRINSKYHKNVLFTGYIDYTTLPFVIHAGDLFPIMYFGDNFPGVVAEIGLSKKPILALKRGGVSEMLTNSKGEFLAYDLGISISGATKRLVKGIINLYSNKQRSSRIAEQVHKHFKNKYQSRKLTKSFFDKYLYYLSKK